jgi:hypothetical protein
MKVTTKMMTTTVRPYVGHVVESIAPTSSGSVVTCARNGITGSV